MNKTIIDPRHWDNYAAQHLRVSTRFQQVVYETTAQGMSGQVVDFGCGSGKITTYLVSNARVSAYTGVDCSPEMLQVAQWLLDALAQPHFELCLSKIDDLRKCGFDSGLSINSYYAWAKPQHTLRKIAASLKGGGVFVLVTPNPRLDMSLLLEEASKELIAHPDFALFREQNLAFARHYKDTFVSMDQLIAQTRDAGFEIEHCHCDFYLGGMNYLRMRKA